MTIRFVASVLAKVISFSVSVKWVILGPESDDTALTGLTGTRAAATRAIYRI